jgi:hypothetical protein
MQLNLNHYAASRLEWIAQPIAVNIMQPCAGIFGFSYWLADGLDE